MEAHGAFTGVVRDSLANVFNSDAARYPGVEPTAGAIYRANLSRTQLTHTVAAITSAVIQSVPLYFAQGETITSLSWFSGSTALGTPANTWAALYSPANVLLGQSTDQPAITWGANAVKTFTLATPVIAPASGFYRAALMVKATTMPTHVGVNLVHANNSTAFMATGDLILSATSDTAMTTTAPAALGTLTGVVGVPMVVAR